MYLRTTRRQNRDGTWVEYYQLAHNFRDPETHRPTAQVIHNFGRADELDRDELVRLCRSIARVCGVEVRDLVEAPTAESAELESAWPEGMRMTETRTYGPILAIEALWERLSIGTTLRAIAERVGTRVPYERALFAMTANRLCAPESKLGVWDRWLGEVHLPSCSDLKLDHMYEAMDLLYEHVAEVEQAIFFRTADLLNLEVDIVFYDTTKASFAIDFEDPDTDDETGLRKRGHNSQGTWSPQVAVALAVTREGIPVRSWLFPGNTSDSTTVERVKADLRGWKLGRCLFVADSGMNSEGNRDELARGCGKYLLAVRAGSVAEVKDDVLKRPGRYKEVAKNLHVKEVVVGDGELRRRYLVCFNPEEELREQRHRAEILELIRADLAEHPERSAKAKWAIDLLASKQKGRYLSVSPDNEIVIDPAKVRDAAKLDGKWVLITNDDTLAAEDAASGYKSLLVIERCFRSLKSASIHLGPVHHWRPNRIEAHVKICVLALLLQRVAELAAHKPWSQVLTTLKKLQVTTFISKAHGFFRRNELASDVHRTLQLLNVKPPALVVGVFARPVES